MIILEDATLTQKGHHEINLSFELTITAKEAHYKVRWWLRDNISMLVDADPPHFVVGERCLWRVPAYIAFPNAGKFSNIGVVDVDAATGEMMDLENVKQAIVDYLEKEVKPHIPPFKLKQATEGFAAKGIPPAPSSKHIIFDDGPAT